MLMRRIKGRAPVSDLFGVKGREWLRGLKLPLEEDETVQACLRHIEFLDTEIAAVDRLIATEALKSPQATRLLTVPVVLSVRMRVIATVVGAPRRRLRPGGWR